MQGGTAGKAIRRSIQGMLEELENNLYEHILTRLVDYGHTFSMELEMAALVSGNELRREPHCLAKIVDRCLFVAGRGRDAARQKKRVGIFRGKLQSVVDRIPGRFSILGIRMRDGQGEVIISLRRSGAE